MKKFLAILMALVMVLAFAACTAKDDGGSATPTPTPTPEATPTPEETTPEDVATPDEPAEPADSVMSYADFVAAELDTAVVVETYVQAKQSWWDDKATVYTQNEDGAYFLYNMACAEADYALLTQGTKIKVSGFKAEWAGEVEIIDATFEIIDGSFIAPATDVTALLGDDALIDQQNKFVAFKGLTVEDSGDGVAFLYNWDGSGEDGSDLYFNASLNGTTYTFTVESYLCDSTTEVYAAVKALSIGDVIDMEGFLYWYEGVNPHITSVTVVG